MNKKNPKQRSVKRPVSNEKADLRFGPAGEVAGFTVAGLAAFSDLNPAAIVRELMQNSLDAAREAERDVAHIRFEMKRHDLNKVPGIQQYRRTFDRAQKDQKGLRPDGTLSDQAKDIVGAIQTCLDSKSSTTLYILDNGIGLDEARMKGILADGVSIKSEASAGAVGNGHLTVVPASDLRYVLYGGLPKPGQMIAAGHAILASHQSEEPMGKDGYFVKELKQDLFDRYVFPQNNEIPEYIKSKLKWIADRWQSGTVVAVPGFNCFRESDDLWDIISNAAACNFFAAFAQKELRVEFVGEDGETKALDHTTIDTTLAQFRDQKRTRSKFLSGSWAFAAFETIRTGQDVTVETELGNVSLKWRVMEEGKTSIDLCRSGMWITNKLPGKLRESQFSGLQPFHCVVLLKAEDGKIHQSVRKAEGPLHNDVSLKRLQPAERKELTRAMETIASKIREIIPPYESEQFKVHDVLSIKAYGAAPGGRRSSVVGKFREVPRRRSRAMTEGESEVEEGSEPQEFERGKGTSTPGRRHRGGRGSFRRAGNALRLRGLAVPTGTRSCRFELTPEEHCPECEIRFALDESLDETCDDTGGEEFVRLKTVTVNGEAVSGSNLTCDEKGNALGVRLGSLDPGKPLNIQIAYELPEGVAASPDGPVVLKTEIIRRAANSAK